MRTRNAKKGEGSEDSKEHDPLVFTPSQVFGALGVLISIVTVWGALQGNVNLLMDRDKIREESIRDLKETVATLKQQLDQLDRRVFVLENQTPEQSSKKQKN